MKKLFCFLLLLPVFINAQAAHKKIKALFLGNSYTYVNNLPGLVYNMALATGDTLIYDITAIGGYSFYNHFTDPNSIAKINILAWDYVIMQGQSQEPSFSPGQVSAQTLPYTIKLDSVVKHSSSCINTVFYETWGRKNGDASNCGFYPPVCTYTGMQNRLKQSYKLFADTTHSIMSPVGEAFRRSITTYPALDLYVSDESHPSLEGSYLAAAVFYEILFQKNALTSTFNPGINANTAAFLKQVAHATVNDSLAVWNIGKYLPWADFEVSNLSSPAFQFQSLSPTLNNAWYFGDGATDATPAPAHYYAFPGTYTISHVVTNGCKKDSVSKTISVMPTGIPHATAGDAHFELYPNPCSGTLYIKNAAGFTNTAVIEIRSALGCIVKRSAFEAAVPTGQLPTGLYFITIYNKGRVYNSHFIKAE